MKRYLPLLLALSLAACGGSDPVADDAVAPPANVTGEAPMPAGAAEAADRAALPLPTDGMGWRGGDGTMMFGPVAGPPQLTVRCEGARLVMLRHAAAAREAKGTLSFTGGGEASSMPARAEADPLAPGGRGWRGDADGDIRNDVAKSFAHGGPVQVTLGGVPDLVVPSAPALGRLMRCGG